MLENKLITEDSVEASSAHAVLKGPSADNDVFVADKSKAFEKADLNHNGVLERNEFAAVVVDGNDQEYKNRLVDSLERAVAKNEELEEGGKEKRTMVNGFWNAFASGLGTIWATEIGDKTFFIAAILSMRHDNLIVFAGAIAALIVMTILSVGLGGVVGYFLPVELTHYAGTVLFVVFGVRMVMDARKMDDSKPNEELAEVEEELEGKKEKNLEDGSRDPLSHGSGKEDCEAKWKVLTQGFIMTFLAEWGDRSQIATITLATTRNALGVTLGACIGHSMCTGLAVVGGKMLATKISEKTVTMVGGILFLIFGAHSLITGPST